MGHGKDDYSRMASAHTPASGNVRRVIPLATSARHSVWCISRGEAQRQSIYSADTAIQVNKMVLDWQQQEWVPCSPIVQETR
jgi:hypothetical protein